MAEVGLDKLVVQFAHSNRPEVFVPKKIEWIKQYEREREASQDNIDNIGIATVKKTLTSRLKHLADKHGFKYNKVSIRNQRTRWGSCSHNNNISLNAKLVKLPVELMDYVILHELVHTRIRNHSKKFWAELDQYVENAKVMAKKLRINGLELV